MLLRDRDNAALPARGWMGAGDGDLEERSYYCHNWRGDVVNLITDTGEMLEWVHHTPYGTPRAMPAGDTDSDGDWDATDESYMTGESPSYDVRADANLDGLVDSSDASHANSITGGYQTLGYDVLSSDGVLNRKALAGYETDTASPELKHVRYRVMNAKLGRWVQRDPIGYADGYNLYAYASRSVIGGNDACGLVACSGVGIGTGVGVSGNSSNAEGDPSWTICLKHQCYTACMWFCFGYGNIPPISNKIDRLARCKARFGENETLPTPPAPPLKPDLKIEITGPFLWQLRTL